MRFLRLACSSLKYSEPRFAISLPPFRPRETAAGSFSFANSAGCDCLALCTTLKNGPSSDRCQIRNSTIQQSTYLLGRMQSGYARERAKLIRQGRCVATTNGCGQTWSTVIRILRRSSKPRSGVRGGRPWSTTGIHFLSSLEVPGARPVYNVHEHRDFASSGMVDVPRIRSLQTVQLEDIASATLLTMTIPWIPAGGDIWCGNAQNILLTSVNSFSVFLVISPPL